MLTHAVLIALAFTPIARAQSIFTVAGGRHLDGRPATSIPLAGPNGVAIDRSGIVYIADTTDHRVRRVDLGGTMTTLAGNGESGFSGDAGPATAAELWNPYGVATDSKGNVFIADSTNGRVRRVDAATGIITSLGGSSGVRAIAIDDADRIFFSSISQIFEIDPATGLLRRIAGEFAPGNSGDGGPASVAKVQAYHLAIDARGNIYFSDLFNGRVRKIDSATQIITTIAGNGQFASSPDGGLATASSLLSPRGIALDPSGNLFIAEGGRIRRVDAATNILTTVAGGSGSVSMNPEGLAIDRAGNLYLTEILSPRVRRIDTARIVTTIAGTGQRDTLGDGGLATSAELRGPRAVAMDSAGNLYVTDTLSGRIRRVDATTGTITTFAGGDPGQPGLTFPSALAIFGSHLYVAEGSRVQRILLAGGSIARYAGSSTFGFEGDGGPATQARLANPSGLAFDPDGNLYIADSGNNRVRKVDASGIITTVAGNGAPGFGADGVPATATSLVGPRAVAIDGNGDLLITMLGSVKRVERATGIIRTVVSRTGDGLAVDAQRNIYFSEALGESVFRVAAGTSQATVYAGRVNNFSGDGGPATAAGLDSPWGLFTDSDGSLFIADSGNSRVRVVYACVTVGEPQLASPADGSTGVATDPRLAWTRAKGAFRYDVLIDTVDPPARVAESDLSSTSYAPTNLEPLTTYYWRVIAKGDPYCALFSSTPSAVRSFTTRASCAVPGPVE
ncbi:MAG TPA: hypothetical protein VIL97_00925 [Thermoanaerobaculia bacterium]